jgi:hypothetical protein
MISPKALAQMPITALVMMIAFFMLSLLLLKSSL